MSFSDNCELSKFGRIKRYTISLCYYYRQNFKHCFRRYVKFSLKKLVYGCVLCFSGAISSGFYGSEDVYKGIRQVSRTVNNTSDNLQRINVHVSNPLQCIYNTVMPFNQISFWQSEIVQHYLSAVKRIWWLWSIMDCVLVTLNVNDADDCYAYTTPAWSGFACTYNLKHIRVVQVRDSLDISGLAIMSSLIIHSLYYC